MASLYFRAMKQLLFIIVLATTLVSCGPTENEKEIFRQRGIQAQTTVRKYERMEQFMRTRDSIRAAHTR